MPATQFIALTFESVSILILSMLLLGLVRTKIQSPLSQNIIMAVIAGLFASGVQFFPIEIAPGVIIDSRNLIVAVAAAFWGRPGLVLTTCLAVMTRIWIGGAGALSGSIGIIVSALAGMLWAMIIPQKWRNGLLGSTLLGLFSCLHMIMPLFLLPPELMSAFFSMMALPLAASSVIGAVVFCYFLQRETMLHETHETLKALANTDALTGIANRRALQQDFNNHHRSKLPIGFLYFDIDWFKRINDQYGHEVGDFVLQSIAKRVQITLPLDANFARIGGEEFVVMLPRSTPSQTRQIAERARRIVSLWPIQYQGQSIHCTISIGLHHMNQPSKMNDALSTADKALYHAKASGKNCIIESNNLPKDADETDVIPFTSAKQAKLHSCKTSQPRSYNGITQREPAVHDSLP